MLRLLRYSPAPASAQSAASGNHPPPFPPFRYNRGGWKLRPRLTVEAWKTNAPTSLFPFSGGWRVGLALPPPPPSLPFALSRSFAPWFPVLSLRWGRRRYRSRPFTVGPFRFLLRRRRFRERLALITPTRLYARRRWRFLRLGLGRGSSSVPYPPVCPRLDSFFRVSRQFTPNKRFRFRIPCLSWISLFFFHNFFGFVC